MALLLALLLAAPGADLGHLPPAPVRQYAIAWSKPLVPGDLLDWQVEELGGPGVDPTTRTVVVGLRSGELRAFRADGEALWEFQAGAGFAAPPLVRDGVVYAGSQDGWLYARDLATGKERWRYEVGEEVGAQPVWVGGLVVFATLEDSVVAVDAGTGTWKWHHRRDQREGFTVRGCAPTVRIGDLLYAGYSDGWVAALDPATGAVKWERRVAPNGDFVDVDGLATDGKALFAASFSGAVTALDPGTGRTLWERKAPGATRLSAADGQVYAVTTTSVLALSARNGNPVWTQPLEGVPLAAPVRAGPRLLVANGRGLLFLDPGSGMRIRTLAPGTGVSTAPAVAGRRVYVLSNGGTLLSLDLE